MSGPRASWREAGQTFLHTLLQAEPSYIVGDTLDNVM